MRDNITLDGIDSVMHRLRHFFFLSFEPIKSLNPYQDPGVTCAKFFFLCVEVAVFCLSQRPWLLPQRTKNMDADLKVKDQKFYGFLCLACHDDTRQC